MKNNGGARPQTHANLDTPSAVFNRRSAPYSDLLQLCRVRILREQGGQMKRVLASYGVAYWTPVGDPGLNRGPSCEVIQTEGRILHARGRRSVGGAQRGRGPTY